MSKGKVVVLVAIVAAIIAFFVLDLRQYFSLEFFQSKRAAEDDALPHRLRHRNAR